MNFITQKDNSIVDLDDVKFVDIYGEFNIMEHASFCMHGDGEYKPFKISFKLKDGSDVIWDFSSDSERNRVKKLIQERLNVDEL